VRGSRPAGVPRPRRLERGRRVVSWTTTLALGVVMVALALLRLGGIQPLVEQSGSMAPELRPGDLLLVSGVPASQVRRGDVITFRDPHGLARTVTHRVLGVRRAAGGRLRVETRGDANRDGEQWLIPASGRVARLRASVHGAGRLARPVGDPRLRGALIAASSAFTAVLSLWRIWRPRR
jgi:signal peptidase I